jgi:hypothetical protein
VARIGIEHPCAGERVRVSPCLHVVRLHRALRFEQEFDIHIRIAGMTDKSLRYACVVSCGGRPVADLAMTIL